MEFFLGKESVTYCSKVRYIGGYSVLDDGRSQVITTSYDKLLKMVVELGRMKHEPTRFDLRGS